MPIRSSACHVAEIRRTVGGKAYSYHLLRRTFREDGKVKHQTLGNLSHLPVPVIDLIRRALRGEPLLGPQEAFEILRTRPHGHVAAVLGTARRLGVDQLLATRRGRERELVLAMLAARILEPGSKLALARGLDREALTSTLGEVLGVESADADELYKAMDWLLPRQARIEAELAKRHLSDGTLVLYDVTSTYFERRARPLAKIGHSRDRKHGSLQIVVGLLCQAEGCPVAVEVFDGNPGDPATLTSRIEKVQKRFGLTRVVFVGDRGLITAARIREEVRPVARLDWITALLSPKIRQLVESGSFHHHLADRVKAHAFLFILAYYVEWHMRRDLAPMLFDDDDKPTAAAMLTSVVAPAQRSPRALNKAHTKHTDDEAPVHSFQALLRDLATIARNRVQPKQAPIEASFDILTTPTPLQQRALDLLKVSLNM